MTDAYSEGFKSISMSLTDVWDIVEDSNGDGELPIPEVEFLPENTVAGVLYTKEILDIIGHPLADKNSHLYFDMDDLERVEAERDSIIEAEMILILETLSILLTMRATSASTETLLVPGSMRNISWTRTWRNTHLLMGPLEIGYQR